jgi:hypothetical protein
MEFSKKIKFAPESYTQIKKANYRSFFSYNKALTDKKAFFFGKLFESEAVHSALTSHLIAQRSIDSPQSNDTSARANQSNPVIGRSKMPGRRTLGL